MAFLVQNDSGTIENANSYVDVSYADSYFALTSNATWAALSSSSKQILLIKATAYADDRFRLNYLSIMLNKDQSTELPRYPYANYQGYMVEGIPDLFKQAICEYALYVNSNSFYLDPVYTNEGTVISKSSTVGPISTSVTYESGGQGTLKQIPTGDRKMKPFIRPENQVFR